MTGRRKEWRRVDRGSVERNGNAGTWRIEEGGRRKSGGETHETEILLDVGITNWNICYKMCIRREKGGNGDVDVEGELRWARV